MQAVRMKVGLIVFVVMLFCSTIAFADSSYTFSVLPPSGNIVGPSGSTIGWGYSITNEDLALWLLTSNLTSSPFAAGTADASLFDFPVVAPNSTVSLPYDPVAHTGLFALTWDTGAPVGFINTGVFTLSAQFWTGNPSAGGSFLKNAADETSAYSATASSPTGVPLPEPSSLALMLAGFLILLLIQYRAIAIRRDCPNRARGEI
jgi:hypothetical protein